MITSVTCPSATVAIKTVQNYDFWLWFRDQLVQDRNRSFWIINID